jgi:hypothetical protein
MEKLPYRDKLIETPVGVKTMGKEIDAAVCLIHQISFQHG